MNKKFHINMLLDEYEAGKRIMKQEKQNKCVKGFLKRTVESLKEYGLTMDDIRKKTSL